MCGYSLEGTNKATTMSWETYKTIIDDISEKAKYVALTSSGEPLLCNRLSDMVSYAKQRGLYVVTTTNGLLLDAKVAEELLSAGLNELRISVDGATKQTYEHIRTGANYEKLIQNIQSLQEIRHKYPTCMIDLHIVFQKDNVQDFYIYADTYKHLADTLSVSMPKTFGYPELRAIATTPMVKPDTCNLLYTMITVLADGSVSICCNNHSQKSLVGHIDSDGFDTIWNNATYNKYRQLHLDGQFDKIELCSGCFFTDIRIEWIIQDMLREQSKS